MILLYFATFIFGLLIGNFATTLLYRLPRDIIPYGFSDSDTQPPFCSKCKHLLRFYEYLPVLSWVSTKGSCNYCGDKISISYFYLEIICAFFSVLCLYLYSQNIDIFVLMFCFCVTASLAFAIKAEHDDISKALTIALIAEAIIFRTLQDQSLIPWLWALCCSAIVLMYILKTKFDNASLHELIHVILPSSVWLEGYELIYMLALIILVYWFKRGKYSDLNLYNICLTVLLILAL
jgi:prepilin signal peptidase PulO-like enzyme (type II secretory pathway)